MPEILGSDHCPVGAEIDITCNPSATADRPPDLCTCYWENYPGKQKKLQFFSSKKKDALNAKLSQGGQLLKAHKPTKASKKAKQSTLSNFLKKAVLESVTEPSAKPEKLVNDYIPQPAHSETPIPRVNFIPEKDQAVWKNILTPKNVPRCHHGDLAEEFTVNKSGPNIGRRFYLCSRPIGSTSEDRCEFFEWKNSKCKS